MTNQQALINNISLLRRYHRMTEAKLAHRLMETITNYRLIEQGIKELSAIQLLKLLRIYKMNIEDILSRKLTLELRVEVAQMEIAEKKALEKIQIKRKKDLVQEIRSDIRSEMKHLRCSKLPNNSFY